MTGWPHSGHPVRIREAYRKAGAGAVVLDAALVVLALAVALEPLLFLRMLDLDRSTGDEGVLLSGARRILHGQVPYRDFLAILPPGPYHITATAFRLFGETLASARILAWLFHLLLMASTLGFAWLLKLGRGGVLAVLLGTAAFGFPYWPILSHHWMADAAVTASALLLWDAGRKGRWGLAAVAGLAGTLGVLLLQDQGVYWIAFATVALFTAPGSRRALLSGFLAGMFAAGLPVITTVVILTPVKEIWGQVVALPFEVYRLNPGNRPAPASGLWDHWQLCLSAGSGVTAQTPSMLAVALGETLMVLASPLALILLGVGLLRGRRNPSTRWTAALLLALVASSTAMALHRPCLLNIAFAFPAAMLGCLWGLRANQALTPRTIMRASSAAFAGLIFAFVASLEASMPFHRGTSFSFPLGQVQNFSAKDNATLAMLEAFPSRLLRRGQSVFCYDYSALWYFLLDVDNPTPYDNFGVEKYSPTCLERLRTSLRSAPPDWIILDGRYGDALGDPIVAWMTASGYSVRARTVQMVIAARSGPQDNKILKPTLGAQE